MNPRIYLVLLLATLVACGGDDDKKDGANNATNNATNNTANNALPDMTVTPDQQVDTPDTAVDTPDQPVDEPDQPIDEPDMEPDQTVDAPDMEPCDQAAVAAAQIAVNTTVSTGEVTVTDGAAGERTAVIDASAGGVMQAATSSYLYLDLTTGQRVDVSDKDAVAATTWHIAFKRSEIRTNGADSGAGAVMVARVDNTTWEAAAPPNPAGGAWVTDDFVSESCELVTYGRGSIQTAFGQWYDYNMMTHAVTPPANSVFFLYNAVTHAAFKLQITGYDSGIYTVRWAPLGGSH